MNCHDAEALLDDFVDGALSIEQDRLLTAHLEVCPACRASEERLRRLIEKARSLPEGAGPAHDLWPGIAARIGGATVVPGAFSSFRPTWRRPVLAAAAVVVAAAALVTAVLVARQGSDNGANQARLATAEGMTPASFGLAQAQKTYAAARAQLLAALEARRATLSPQTVEVVEKNLQIIDRAVEEMQAALAGDPGNSEIPALLVATYQQEIDLLQRVTSLPGRG